MTHTPEPWTADKCRCGHRSCNQYVISCQRSAGFDQDDANLIAASPELLRLCELVNDSFGGGRVMTFSDADIQDFADVIAKAKGATQ